MITIHKQTLGIGSWTAAMPEGAKILAVKGQGEDVCVWYSFEGELTPDRTLEQRHFYTVATGRHIENPVGTNLQYIDTAILLDSKEAWHVFEMVGR